MKIKHKITYSKIGLWNPNLVKQVSDRRVDRIWGGRRCVQEKRIWPSCNLSSRCYTTLRPKNKIPKEKSNSDQNLNLLTRCWYKNSLQFKNKITTRVEIWRYVTVPSITFTSALRLFVILSITDSHFTALENIFFLFGFNNVMDPT